MLRTMQCRSGLLCLSPASRGAANYFLAFWLWRLGIRLDDVQIAGKSSHFVLLGEQALLLGEGM